MATPALEANSVLRVSTVVLFNKPYGVLCQFGPTPGRITLRDFLPQRGIYPAGRLDADSEGLVVLTDDGALQHEITDPRHKLPKIYWVQVEGIPTPEALTRLRDGVQLPGYTTRAAGVHARVAPPWLWERVPPIRSRLHIPTSWLEVVLTEGKNRQVRHMTAAVGFPTLRLIRYSIGPWNIAGLEPARWREEEVRRAAGSGRESRRGARVGAGQRSSRAGVSAAAVPHLTSSEKK